MVNTIASTATKNRLISTAKTEYMETPQSKIRQFKQITEVVINKMGLQWDELFKKSRKREYAICRHLSMFFIRNRTGATLMEIGTFFKRHHSAVISALKEVDNKLDVHDSFVMETYNRCCAEFNKQGEIDPVFLHNIIHCPQF